MKQLENNYLIKNTIKHFFDKYFENGKYSDISELDEDKRKAFAKDILNAYGRIKNKGDLKIFGNFMFQDNVLPIEIFEEMDKAGRSFCEISVELFSNSDFAYKSETLEDVIGIALDYNKGRTLFERYGEKKENLIEIFYNNIGDHRKEKIVGILEDIDFEKEKFIISELYFLIKNAKNKSLFDIVYEKECEKSDDIFYSRLPELIHFMIEKEGITKTLEIEHGDGDLLDYLLEINFINANIRNFDHSNYIENLFALNLFNNLDIITKRIGDSPSKFENYLDQDNFDFYLLYEFIDFNRTDEFFKTGSNGKLLLDKILDIKGLNKSNFRLESCITDKKSAEAVAENNYEILKKYIEIDGNSVKESVSLLAEHLGFEKILEASNNQNIMRVLREFSDTIMAREKLYQDTIESGNGILLFNKNHDGISEMNRLMQGEGRKDYAKFLITNCDCKNKSELLDKYEETLKEIQPNAKLVKENDKKLAASWFENVKNKLFGK